jgi:three-Cys-motif partner protein
VPTTSWASSTAKSGFGRRSISKEYASAYATIMEAQRRARIRSLRWIYIDAYAGPGYHFSKTSGELVEGSPLIALNTVPPFHEYHCIDTESRRAKRLRGLAGDRADVFIYSEDCNAVLLREVFPRARMVTTGGRSASWTHTISI